MDRRPLEQRRKEMIAKVKDVARQRGRRVLSRSQFVLATGIPETQIVRDFAHWTALCRAAGIATYRREVRLTDDEVFGAMREAFLAAGGVPGIHVFERHFRFTRNVLRRRGMNWPQAKARCRRWLEANDPGFPYLDKLPRSADATERSPAAPKAALARPVRIHPAFGTRLIGEPINFRALAHAPVDESAVILLFGMVAEELGYVIEVMNRSFPDCEARRRVAGGRWERVRIEFEYQSRNFLVHGHNPKGCELIICWEHNWEACPLEVLELKKIIKALTR